MKTGDLVCLAVAAALGNQTVLADRMDGSKLHNLTKEVETPHLEWAEKLPGGTLKTLFVVSLSQARAAVEAAAEDGIQLETTYTGKALAGLMTHARHRGEGWRRVLFWNTFNSRPVPGSSR